MNSAIFPLKTVQTLFLKQLNEFAHSPWWSATIDESIGLENVVPGTLPKLMFSKTYETAETFVAENENEQCGKSNMGYSGPHSW